MLITIDVKYLNDIELVKKFINDNNLKVVDVCTEIDKLHTKIYELQHNKDFQNYECPEPDCKNTHTKEQGNICQCESKNTMNLEVKYREVYEHSLFLLESFTKHYF